MVNSFLYYVRVSINGGVMKHIFALFLVLGLASGALHAKAKVKNKGNFGIAGWLVYWDPKSMEVYEKNAALIDRVYPEWYVIGPDGLPFDNVNNYKTPQEKADFVAKKKKTVEIARKNGIQIFSMIVNFDNVKFEHSTERVQKFLYDKKLRAKHIKMLVDNAVKDGADGIDIDYENGKAKDAALFVQFMKELRKEADKKNLLLAAALAPKTDADGTWDGNQAHDYKGLAPYLDLIRPMTYDEHWATSTAGPVSSPEFSEMVDRYAVAVSSPEKVEIGIAGYGYDWLGNKGNSIAWADLQALKAKGVPIKRDEETGELTARYGSTPETMRELWFCDAGSYRPKYEIIKKYKLAGMAMWRFGSEDPSFWTDVQQFKFAKNWR